MTPEAVALTAWAGLYLYVALYHGATGLMSGRSEYGPFAGFCLGLAVFSAATAMELGAASPADAAGLQHLQYLALTPAIGMFVLFLLRLLSRPWPTLRRVTVAWMIFGAGAAAARLFFDPARADPTYDWSSGPDAQPSAALLPLGGVSLLVGVLLAATATYLLAREARGRVDLRSALAVTALAIAAGTVDLAARLLAYHPVDSAAHAALLPVLGFSYVLVGRFTGVDTQLHDRTQELERSHDHLRQAQEELLKKEQLAAVGELSAVIAHEVRNPLAIIKNAVGGLGRPELGAEDASTLLHILDDETDRLNRLVNDLLAYAKPISAGLGSVDLRRLVMHAVELAAGGRRSMDDVEIELDLSEEVDEVEGDENLLRHALINIVDNALQAMPSGGVLTVSCRERELDGREHVCVNFHDTGEGMDTLVRSRARDPFFTTRQTGTGLGLAIVDRVARAHGGRVEIESRHGKGTTVSFVLPKERGSLIPPAS